MRLPTWPSRVAIGKQTVSSFVLCSLCLFLLLTGGQCMSHDRISELKRQTVELFYHGFDNYMLHAFPEDELKPLSCQPLTRDRANPAHIEVNDVLGNYSLTLIDSLSTLAILASPDLPDDRNPLHDFQHGIKALVDLYGDGSEGPRGQGTRSRGFDLDSKVQVFETVIRGVGGLLSAHLFAIGELPMRGYNALDLRYKDRLGQFAWIDGFVYDGQLLRLAEDLANRILPAFYTATGLPYPRVNLRSGVAFYPNSPLNVGGQCERGSEQQEITETCSAGAGSLVLEFALLTRLTGDTRYEELATRAFHAVWERRSDIGLIGAGIDAETGQWVAPYTGIGAGVDSFFEYAVKTHIMLSGVPELAPFNSTKQNPEFLDVWLDAHAGVKRHLYRGAAYQHPHFIQGDVFTGATRAFWLDSLSAFYPGLLALSGEVDEAIETHMLFTALWTRYSALPERWNAASGTIDMGMKWWPGRPEFIESTWYLYRATEDPWYLHVGEMVLTDIRSRCRTHCGWAGLEDVRTGELKDRMESFFLGETAKYMSLLFDPSHPLNHWDAPFVFTTEGHPLVLPRSARGHPKGALLEKRQRPASDHQPLCPASPKEVNLFSSPVVARKDFFHAAHLARLYSNHTESSVTDPNLAQIGRESPNNFTLYPWTLPPGYMPYDGTSSPIESRVTFDLSFPTLQNAVSGSLTLRRVGNSMSIGSVSGLKLSMIRERDDFSDSDEDIFRISGVSHLSLGRDETVTITPEVAAELNPTDPFFTRHRELAIVDLVVDSSPSLVPFLIDDQVILESTTGLFENLTESDGSEDGGRFQGLLQQLSSLFKDNVSLLQTAGALLSGQALAGAAPTPYHMLEASTATGMGAATLPDIPDAPRAPPVGGSVETTSLPWTSIYFSRETCDEPLPPHVPRQYQVVVMRRGGCSFAEKLRSIPAFAPAKTALQLVVIVSDSSLDIDHAPVRPLLDEPQLTPGGLDRAHQIPLIMVEGGDAAWDMLKQAQGVGLRRRYWYSSQGLRINNLFVV